MPVEEPDVADNPVGIGTIAAPGIGTGGFGTGLLLGGARTGGVIGTSIPQGSIIVALPVSSREEDAALGAGQGRSDSTTVILCSRSLVASPTVSSMIDWYAATSVQCAPSKASE